MKLELYEQADKLQREISSLKYDREELKRILNAQKELTEGKQNLEYIDNTFHYRFEVRTNFGQQFSVHTKRVNDWISKQLLKDIPKMIQALDGDINSMELQFKNL